jgi:hypothetical protein
MNYEKQQTPTENTQKPENTITEKQGYGAFALPYPFDGWLCIYTWSL